MSKGHVMRHMEETERLSKGHHHAGNDPWGIITGSFNREGASVTRRIRRSTTNMSNYFNQTESFTPLLRS